MNERQFIGGTLVEDGKIMMRYWDLVILKAKSPDWNSDLCSPTLEGKLFANGAVDADTAMEIIDLTECQLKKELACIDAYRRLFRKWGAITIEEITNIAKDMESNIKNRVQREEYQDTRDILDQPERYAEAKFLSGKYGERHREEYRMWLDGATYKEIAERFSVTPELIRQNIIHTGRILKCILEDETDEPQGKTPYELFLFFIRKVAEKHHLQSVAIRAANAFARRNRDCEDYMDKLRETGPDELMKIRNIGHKSLELLTIAKKVLEEEETL